MKKQTTRVLLSFVVLVVSLMVFHSKASAAVVGTTVANGVDYSAVYNYQYYIQHNTDVAQAFNGDDVATLNHFILHGMNEGRQASETFDVHSYYLEYPDLRQAFGSDLKAYYLHYIYCGEKEKRIATNVTQRVGNITAAGGVDYSAVYDYTYYLKHNPDVAQATKGDDVAALNDFIWHGMNEGRQASESFDVHSYYLEYPDLRQAYGSNLKAYYLDYMNHGKNQGRIATGETQLVGTTVANGVDYCAVYNYQYYIKHNPDVAQAFNGDDVATLNHFILHGMNEGRQASETFDVHSYYLEYPDLRQAFGSDLKDYYLHYIYCGEKEKRIATNITQRVGNITTAGGVDYSAVYDYQYYIKNYPDVATEYKDDDVAILNHFIESGMSAGQQASESFDVHSYYLEYPDLRQAYGSNLKAYYLDYINQGKNQGRIATGETQLVGTTVANGVDYSAVYNYQYYIKNNPDVAQAFNGDDVATLNHFILHGMNEGRQASETFDVHSYYLEYPDLRQAFGSDLKAYYLHYIYCGEKEKRIATNVTKLVGTTVANGVDYSAVYNYQYYIQHNTDVARATNGDDVATLNHFIACGMSEGRQASETFDVHSYYLEYPDLRQAFGSDLKDYYLHYIYCGEKEKRIATNIAQRVGNITAAGGVDYSAVYDYTYYLKYNPDVAQAYNGDDVATLNHFIWHGMNEGRQASELFDVHSYYLEYPDLRQAFGSNLKAYYLHYINCGKNERRIATGISQLVPATVFGGVDYSAVYNYQYYIQNNPDVARAYGGNDIAVLDHFVEYGMNEGRQASDDFNVWYYRANYPDLQFAYGNNMEAYYLHYMHYGKAEERNGKTLSHDFTGWCTIGTAKYYYNQGTYETGMQTIDGLKYLFSNSGVLLSKEGIDVYRGTGVIDWQQVKNSGVDFAIIKIGGRGYGSGEVFEDANFETNYNGAIAAGIKVGVYFFSQAISVPEAQEEASFVLNILHGRGLDEPVAFDTEYVNDDARANGLSAGDRTKIAATFCSAIQANGYTPMVYASKDWMYDDLNMSSLSSYKTWVAHYISSPTGITNYNGNYQYWQYSSTGSVPGISGAVDLDILFP